MTVLAVMVALSAMGRFVFAWLPGFKPVTAITVIAAVWLGSSSGFMVGSLSALFQLLFRPGAVDSLPDVCLGNGGLFGGSDVSDAEKKQGMPLRLRSLCGCAFSL